MIYFARSILYLIIILSLLLLEIVTDLPCRLKDKLKGICLVGDVTNATWNLEHLLFATCLNHGPLIHTDQGFLWKVFPVHLNIFHGYSALLCHVRSYRGEGWGVKFHTHTSRHTGGGYGPANGPVNIARGDQRHTVVRLPEWGLCITTPLQRLQVDWLKIKPLLLTCLFYKWTLVPFEMHHLGPWHSHVMTWRLFL